MKSVKAVHRKLLKTGLSLAIAESCTGGWIAKLITDNPGSSQYLKGATVVYSIDSKEKLLGIKLRTMNQAVTRKTAVQMAKKVRQRLKTDYSVSTTGYMEPSYELSVTKLWKDAQRKVKKKVTGVCFIAMTKPSGITQCREIILTGTRRQNRLSASSTAMNMLREDLERYTSRSKK